MELDLVETGKNIDQFFRYESEEYKNNTAPLSDYVTVSNHVLSAFSNGEDLDKGLKAFIKDGEYFKDPTIYFKERDLAGKRSKNKTSLSKYIAYAKETGDVMVPSFTVYFNKKKKKSLHAEFISINVKERSKHKKLAGEYFIDGEFEKFILHNVIQKTKKIFNNSLSGAYASAGTVLNNPSAHYTLTSMTRCIAGIGNAISEQMIVGNRHYRTPDVAFNHIATIATKSNLKEIESVIKKYNIYLPTPTDVMESLAKSTRKYWRSMDKELVIFNYLRNITGIQRAAILYSNDMFHIRKYNEELIRSMISNLLNYELLDITDSVVDTIISNAEDWLINLVVHTQIDRVKGKRMKELDSLDRRHIASTIINLNQQFTAYGEIIRTFFITDIFPVSIATIKDMVREAIVLSDTDSTCATYEDWSQWYLGGTVFSSESVAVSAVVMTIVTQVMDHYIKAFAVNMNISHGDAQVLAMKNEFFWDVFVNTNVSKHYFANMIVKEGDVFNFDDPLKTLEKKGVQLIAPTVYGPVRDLSEKMMTMVMGAVSSNKKIDINEYIDMTIEAETTIYNKLIDGSPDVLKLEKIKESKAYSKGENESPYVHYKLWEEVFSEKYTHAPDPTYMAIKVPTPITSKGKMKEFLNKMEDKQISDKLRYFIDKVGKTHIATFRLPLIIVYNNGIPKELLPLIDFKRVILDNCKVLYYILESIGMPVKEKTTLLETIGHKEFL